MNRFLVSSIAGILLASVSAGVARLATADAPARPYRVVLSAIASDSSTAGPTPGDSGAMGEIFTVQPPADGGPGWLDDLRAGGNPRDPERGLTDWMLETTGVRTPAGGSADESFRLIDGERSLAVESLIARLRSSVRAADRAAVLARLPGPAARAQQVSSLSQVGGASTIALLAMSTELFTGKGDLARAASSLSPVTTAVNENGVHGELTVTPKLSGSKLESEVKVSLATEKDGVAYAEKNRGTVRVDVCPDAQGSVLVEIEYEGGVSAGPAGGHWSFHGQVTGHVDDDANLVAADFAYRGEMSTQPTTRRDKFAEWTMGYAISGFQDRSFAHGSTSAELGRNAVHAGTQAEAQLWMNNATAYHKAIVELVAYFTLTQAEKLWQGGSCVEILAPSPNSVQPGSETPFTASVRQKIEGAELDAPVVATLTSGELSVAPSGTKVPAPATFAYRAPDHTGDAIVKLESRSGRGVGTLDVAFTTAKADFLLDFETVLMSQQDETHARAVGAPVRIHSPGGTAPLQLLGARAFGPGCTVVTTAYPAEPFRVLGAEGVLGADGQFTDFVINIDTGNTGGTEHWTCPSPLGVITFDLEYNFLWHRFSAGHQKELLEDFSFSIRDWTILGGDVYARKTYSQTSELNGWVVTESTTLTLRRAP